MRPDGWVAAAIAVAWLLSGCAATGGGNGGSTDGTDNAPATTEKRPAPEPLTKQQAALETQAEVAVEKGAFEDAYTHLQALHGVRPDMASVTARMGWMRQKQSRMEAAMTLYREAVAVDPGQRLALNNLALLERQQGRFSEARRWFEQGLQWHPDSARLHYNLAVLLELHLLELEQALAHYKRYQALRSVEDTTVAGWITDLERRVN